MKMSNIGEAVVGSERVVRELGVWEIRRGTRCVAYYIPAGFLHLQITGTGAGHLGFPTFSSFNVVHLSHLLDACRCVEAFLSKCPGDQCLASFGFSKHIPYI